MTPRAGQSTSELPAGTVTFLFTDIEGSTRLLHQLGEDYVMLLTEHHRLLRRIFGRHNGREVDTEGDAFFVSFPRAANALAAVVEAQREIAQHDWPGNAEVQVRMGLHTGEPWTGGEGYVGMDVHRAARIAQVGFGGQVLLSKTTASLVEANLPTDVQLIDLGHHRLKDMAIPEHIHQLVIEGLPADFPPLKSLGVVAPPQPYEFEPPEPPPFLKEVSEEPERPVFVSRQRELAWLEERLGLTVEGQGQVVFVTGEAGMGKSSLLGAFARKAVEVYPKLLVTWGQCNAFSGQGNPYLPFREIFAQLCGGVESPWRSGLLDSEAARRLWVSLPEMAELIKTKGANLVEQFLSGQELLGRLKAASPDQHALHNQVQALLDRDPYASASGGQSRLFEQATAVLETLSRKHPLLIILDDMQWVDRGSVDLLFQLGRQIASHRILVVAAYRPEEVAAGRRGERHPLEAMVDEFKRIHGDQSLDLAQVEGRAFVDAFIDSEPNALDKAFRDRLFRRTGGHALFTVELLRDMQERGNLVQDDDGSWVGSERLDWELLPARVEGVIESRIGRLEESLREILTVASVEGETFTAQVVARVQELQERKLLRNLSRELAKRHHLVTKSPEIHLGDRFLSRYRFAHNLFQRYLYNDLSDGERRMLHGEIAAILEDLYGENLDDITVQLAVHFDEAGESEKATRYFLIAGDEARARYAQQEAADHYERALDLLRKGSKHEQMARTLMKLGLTLHNLHRFRDSQEAFNEGFRQLQLVEAELPTTTLAEAKHALRIANFSAEGYSPDPLYRMYEDPFLYSVYGRLLKLGPDMEIIPDGAISWEISPDGLTYTFHLRDDAYWSDGEPVTVKDYLLTLRALFEWVTPEKIVRLLSKTRIGNAGAPGLDHTDPVDIIDIGVGRRLKVYVPDDRTLLLSLSKSMVHFLPQLIMLFPIPLHIVKRTANVWDNQKKIISNGSFLVCEIEEDNAVSLIRNPHYYDAFRGNVEQVKLFPLKYNFDDAVSMYEKDELDVLPLSKMPLEQRNRLRHKHADDYYQFPTLDTIYLAFNVRHSMLQDVRFRQALAMATDREVLSQIILSGIASQATGGFLPTGMPGHNKGINWPFDPGKAKALLDDAGYTESLSSIELPMIYLGGSLWRTIVDFLKEQWGKILNITVSTKKIDHDHFQQPLEAFDLEIGGRIMGWIADYPDPHNFLVDTHIQERTFWHSDQYASLLQKAAKTTDPEQRIKFYSQADRLLIEQVVILPLCYRVRSHLIKPWVSNYYVDALGERRLKDVIIRPH